MRRTILAGAAAHFLAACAHDGATTQATTPGETWATRAPEAAGFDPGLLRRLEAAAASGNTHSMIIVRGGEVVFSYGDVARSEGTYTASVRKSILAMLMGEWVEKGVIDLDATLAELGVDDVEGLSETEKTATIRDLISARSGVYHPVSYGSGNPAADPARASHEPGTYYWYNNWDFNAAGAIFEDLTGRDIYEAFDAQLAQPLGLQDFDLAKHLTDGKSGDTTRSRFPAYVFILSTRDMARLGLLMLREGRWGDARIIAEDWIDESVSLITDNDEMNPQAYRESGFGYGYMWWVMDPDEFPAAYRGGYAARGHYGQYIVVLPALDLVIAHKTLPQDYDSPEEYESVNVTWTEMRTLIDLALAALHDAPPRAPAP